MVVDEAGQEKTINTQTAPKVSTHLVTYDAKTVPSGPPTDVPSFENLDPPIQRVITQLRVLIEERPIWTRRAILNNMAIKEQTYAVKQAFQYVGYMFKSGPWRDAVVRFGLDPRTDPKYRIYQTLMFHMYSREADVGRKKWEAERTRKAKLMKGKELNPQSHLFDGKQLDMDGKVWQVCDITDPILRSILDTEHLRETCDLRSDGWYHNGTWAKAKVIMKAKIAKIMEGEVPSDTDFAKLLEIPDIIDESTRHQAVLLKGKATPQEVQWATDIRASAGRQAFYAEGKVAPRTRDLGQDLEVDDSSIGTGAPIQAVVSRVAEAMLELGQNVRDVEKHFDVNVDPETAENIEAMDTDSERISDNNDNMDY